MRTVRDLCLFIGGCTLGTGCTYLQNRLDDLQDIFVIGVGGTTAANSPQPPAFGFYLEATEYCHFGGTYFGGYMVGIDRRSAEVVRVDTEVRGGFGPFHRWYLDETCIAGNGYKSGAMDWWETRMADKSIRRLAFRSPTDVRWKDYPAKRMTFEDAHLDRFPRGWQDWGYFGVDIAICEPFFLHVGVRARAGIDFSQGMDFALGIFGLDLYGDDATEEELRAGSPLRPQPAGRSQPTTSPASSGPSGPARAAKILRGSL